MKRKMHKRKVKSLKEQRAITLVALVVTIVVLIILAAISINGLIGENGLITTAKKAAFLTEIKQIEEQYQLYIAAKSLEENGKYKYDSLTAGKDSLFYDGTREEGDITTVLPIIEGKRKTDFEILKGELYFQGRDEQELKWAYEAGFKVIPFIIENGVLKSATTNLLLLDGNGAVTIPGNVIKIDHGVFNDLEGLKKVIVPNTVREIANNAFSNNTTLEEITIEEGIEIIGDYAFSGCTALKEIIIPDSVTYIGESCFERCESLKKIKLSKSITKITTHMFRHAKQLENLEIPEGVEIVGTQAFYGCIQMSTIEIPKSLKKIEKGALNNIPNLTAIHVSSENESFKFEDGMLLSKNGQTLYFVLANLTYLKIADTVTNLNGEIFGRYFYSNSRTSK